MELSKRLNLSPNPLFFIENRSNEIHHARLRLGCSKLNYDLCQNLHVVLHESCSCGHNCEDATHYLLKCPNFTIQRNQLIQQVIKYTSFTVRTLLWVDAKLNLNQNTEIMKSVHKFFVDTARFE